MRHIQKRKEQTVQTKLESKNSQPQYGERHEETVETSKTSKRRKPTKKPRSNTEGRYPGSWKMYSKHPSCSLPKRKLDQNVARKEQRSRRYHLRKEKKHKHTPRHGRCHNHAGTATNYQKITQQKGPRP